MAVALTVPGFDERRDQDRADPAAAGPGDARAAASPDPAARRSTRRSPLAAPSDSSKVISSRPSCWNAGELVIFGTHVSQEAVDVRERRGAGSAGSCTGSRDRLRTGSA